MEVLGQFLQETFGSRSGINNMDWIQEQMRLRANVLQKHSQESLGTKTVILNGCVYKKSHNHVLERCYEFQMCNSA